MSDLQELASRTAKETVTELFKALGVDISTPAAVIETQQDFAWTRSARLTVRKLRMHAITVLVGLVVTGIAYATWNAIQAPRAETTITQPRGK